MSKVTLGSRKGSPPEGVLLKERFKRPATAAVLLLHGVGLIGLTLPQTRQLFLMLTPFHLLLVSFLLFALDGNSPLQVMGYLLVAGGIGFGAEVVGIQQGWLFGTYSYGAVLGPAAWGVPFLIGLNWAMLAYLATGLLLPLRLPLTQKVVLAALLLTGLDACMEPAAVGLGFWHWPAGYVPGQNYLGWTLTGLPVCLSRFLLLKDGASPVSSALWWCQVVFFFTLSLWVFPSH